jgi:hypothetical protein
LNFLAFFFADVAASVAEATVVAPTAAKLKTATSSSASMRVRENLNAEKLIRGELLVVITEK